MAQVNPLTREVLIKLVYYGPGLGGKTTTLQRVHSVSPAETRGKIVSLATPVDRTLYFDFLPLRVGPVKGYPVRLQLFTVPGQVYFNATRKLVLTGADGVVFVADSQRERQDANVESLQNLRANLVEQNRQLEDIPHVLQYNKRDLPNVVPLEQLDQALNELDAPSFSSSATKGEGVLEPLDELVRRVLEDLERREVFGEPEDSTNRPRAQPSFGPAADGLDASLSRASEELWSNGASSSPPHASAASAPLSSMEASGQTFGDLPPVGATPGDLTSGSPAAARTPAEPLGASAAAMAFGYHSSVPATGSAPAPRPPTFGPSQRPSEAAPHGLSWSVLFGGDQRDTVLELEAELTAGETQQAVLRCESLALEILAGVAEAAALPGTERQPTVLALALGLPGDRWLGFRRLARCAKQGEPIGQEQALEAYGLVLEVNRLARRARR